MNFLFITEVDILCSINAHIDPFPPPPPIMLTVELIMIIFFLNMKSNLCKHMLFGHLFFESHHSHTTHM